MEDDEMDSLFEGMVLCTPSQLAADQNDDPKSQLQSYSQSQSIDTSTEEAITETVTAVAAAAASEPLDENLFSDLTLQTPAEQDQSQSSPSVTKLKSSRKKKRAAGLRIGYGRDMRSQPSALGDDDGDDDDDYTIYDASVNSSMHVIKDTDHNYINNNSDKDPHQRFEHLKTLISEKLNRARELAVSVSEARKDSIRRRRKAADDLEFASLRHSQLQKQLDEVCEAEDFEAAQRISDDLAAAENQKQSLLIALRDAESHCDAIDSKMHEVLVAQIAAEEDCASLLDHFSAVSTLYLNQIFFYPFILLFFYVFV